MIERKTIVELIGTLGVIASLLFVGHEIRQNTAVARAQAYQSFMSEVHVVNDRAATDERLAGLLVGVFREDATIADFSEEENIRLRSHYLGLLRTWEGLHRSVLEGILDDRDLEIVGGGGSLQTPYFRELWPDLRAQFTDSFVAFLEARFSLR